jgi:hypothetical protein
LLGSQEENTGVQDTQLAKDGEQGHDASNGNGTCGKDA